MNRYQLRNAAGYYWLIDMEQKRFQYKCPIALNESGAYIWRLYERNKDLKWIGKELAEAYDIPLQVAEKDARELLEALKEQGII